MYQQYRDQYTVEGQRAAQNALAQVATRTGGLASSYAQSASQQAGQYYARQLADKVPELRQLAYQMYLNEGDRLRSDLQMYDALDSADASRWAATVLSPYQADRAYAMDVDNQLYSRGRDALADDRYERQYADSRADVAYDRKLSAAAAMAQFGNFSGYADLWGLPQEAADAMVAEYAQQRQMTKDQAARDLADWYAQYGDFSRLKSLGVNTSALEKQQALAGKSGSGGGPTKDPLDIIWDMSESEAKRKLLSMGYQKWQMEEYMSLWKEGHEATATADRGLANLNARLAALEDSGSARSLPTRAAQAIRQAQEAGQITEETARRLLAQYGISGV